MRNVKLHFIWKSSDKGEKMRAHLLIKNVYLEIQILLLYL